MYLSRQFLLLCFFIFLCGWRLPRKSRLVTAHERPFLNLNFSQKFPNFSQKFPNKIQKFQKTNQPKNRLVHPELWVVHFWKVSKKCLSPKAFVHVSDTCNDLSNPRVSTTKESQSCHAVAISCERPWDYHQHYFEGHFRNALLTRWPCVGFLEFGALITCMWPLSCVKLVVCVAG